MRRDPANATTPFQDALVLAVSLLIVLVLLLGGCTPTPVYRDKIVDVPIVRKCKVTLPAFPGLPTDQPMPEGLTPKGKRRWILSAMYRDIVLMEGEVKVMETEVRACE